jgi:hypothetical protein
MTLATIRAQVGRQSEGVRYDFDTMHIRNLVVLFFAAVLTLLAMPLPAAPASEYAGLLEKVKGGDTSIDFQRLRLSWVDSPEYKDAKDVSKAEKEMMTFLDAKEYDKALKASEKVLASEYVNADAHFVEYSANKALGHEDEAQFHLKVFRGLMDSIVKHGDGLSAETAWVVINVHEEYVVLNVLGYRPSEQSMLSRDGHTYDRMDVKSVEDGSKKTFYFNVDISFKHMGI